MAEEKKERAVTAKVVKETQGSGTSGTQKEKTYPIRGNVFEGKVVSAKSNKTVTIERELTHYISKYERYLKIRSRIKAHNPESINAKEGDIVTVGETRRISKTKSFVVIKILNKGENN